MVFGARLPRALTAAFIPQALRTSEGIIGLSAAVRGLVAARTAVLAAVAAIDADIKQLVRAFAACRPLMTIPGVGQLTALALTSAIDDPGRFRWSRDIGAYLGLVPRPIAYHRAPPDPLENTIRRQRILQKRIETAGAGRGCLLLSSFDAVRG
jgi:transposase